MLHLHQFLIILFSVLIVRSVRSKGSLEGGSVLFVTDNFNSQQALFRHRGIETAALLNSSWATCEEVTSAQTQKRFLSFRVFVHVKVLCTPLLGLALTSTEPDEAVINRGYHVYDVVDAPATQTQLHQWSRHLDAMVMSTLQDLRVNCRSRLCLRIPHHYNLNCSAINTTAPRGVGVTLGVVGTLHRYSSDFNPSQFSLHNITLRREHAYPDPCSFFRDIDLALAWCNPKHSGQRDLARKPAERFTNPVVLGIPTVGCGLLASFRLPGSSPFLTSSREGVLPLVERLAGGALREEFRVLRESVWRDVAPERVRERYVSLLASLSEQPPVALRAGPIRRSSVVLKSKTRSRASRLEG